MANHISNYDEVKKYIAKARKLKSAARKFKREVPKLIGKYVLSQTRQPMLNKDGQQITYKDKNGNSKKRYRNLHDVDEFKKKYSIFKKSYNSIDTKDLIDNGIRYWNFYQDKLNHNQNNDQSNNQIDFRNH